MHDPAIEEILKRIENYDGSEEGFKAILADLLKLIPERPALKDFRKELARRCGPVAVSTVDAWARPGPTCPGPNVRRFVLGEASDILNGRP
ncbi:MAG TPA: hypothetical protein VJ694_05150 [Patescibacteria group bacterium]|nr:hypothetical protein [Patescibacteria group bacterium]